MVTEFPRRVTAAALQRSGPVVAPVPTVMAAEDMIVPTTTALVLMVAALPTDQKTLITADPAY